MDVSAICWALAAFKVPVKYVDLFILGFVFVALAFVF